MEELTSKNTSSLALELSVYRHTKCLQDYHAGYARDKSTISRLIRVVSPRTWKSVYV